MVGARVGAAAFLCEKHYANLVNYAILQRPTAKSQRKPKKRCE
jgi:hypothetical protein